MKAENGFEELALDRSNWHRARKDFVPHRKHPLVTRSGSKKNAN
jgi:DNA polymerase IIIc chi subunit